MAGFPFHPLEDSILGKLIRDTFIERGGKQDDLLIAIRSNIADSKPDFLFTPNGEKQVLLNLIPPKIRQYIAAQDFESIVEIFEELAKGTEDSPPKLDVALELLEWIITGFDEEELEMQLISCLTDHKIDLPFDFCKDIKTNYQKLLEHPEN